MKKKWIFSVTETFSFDLSRNIAKKYWIASAYGELPVELRCFYTLGGAVRYLYRVQNKNKIEDGDIQWKFIKPDMNQGETALSPDTHDKDK